MHNYAITFKSYSQYVEQLDKVKLAEFKRWLNENTNMHLTCNAYNPIKSNGEHYRNIYNADFQLNSSLYLFTNWPSRKPDKHIEAELKENYQLMSNATKIFIQPLEN